MGLIDRLQRERDTALRQAEQAKQRRVQEAEAARLAEQKAYQRETEASIKAYRDDAQAVLDLIKGLPKTDYAGKLRQISELSKYGHDTILYSRSFPYIGDDHPVMQSLNKQESTLRQALEARSLPYDSSGRYLPRSHPSSDFFGAGKLNGRGGCLAWFGTTMEEPHLPGLGIHFQHSTCIRNPETRNGISGKWETTTRRDVYVRFYSSSDSLTGLVTGAIQQSFPYTRFEQLDEALDRAFTDPLVRKATQFTPDPPQPYNGGD